MSYAAAVVERDADNNIGMIHEPICERVIGRVKWYDPLKGYGFVHLTERAVDAMLHVKAIDGLDPNDMQIGVTVECEIWTSPKGLRVARIIQVDVRTADPQAFVSLKPVKEPGPMFEAVVKWYRLIDGFGFFFDPNGGEDDIFIHAATLEAHGIKTLQEGQIWRIGVIEGSKGRRQVGTIAPTAG